MVMNLVQQGEDLQNFSDEALAGELQTGQRGYLPIAVISEIERRVRDRERYQQNAMAQQAADTNPVAQQRLMELMGQGQPQGMDGMEGAAQAQPQPGMAPQAPGMGMGMSGPMAAPQAAPVGIMGAAPQGMPVQGMAEGGIVRAQEGLNVRRGAYPSGLSFQSPLRRAQGLVIRDARALAKSGRTEEAIALLQKERIDPARVLGSDFPAGSPAESSASFIDPSAQATPVVSSAPGIAQNIDFVNMQGLQGSIFDRKPGTDFSDRAAKTPPEPPQFSMPRSSDFMGTYKGIRQDLELQPYQVKSQYFDPFFIEERERLKALKPDRESFKKEREADLLVGLGSVIAGATRRGDIAQGLAGLAAQQREAQKELKREEREYMGIESALRREERAEEAARRDRQRAMEREEREESRYQDQVALALTQQVALAERDERDARLQVQQLNVQLQAARDKAEREGMSAQLKMLMDTVTMQLRQAQTELANAQAAKARAEAEAAGRFPGSGATPARDVFGSPAR